MTNFIQSLTIFPGSMRKDLRKKNESGDNIKQNRKILHVNDKKCNVIVWFDDTERLEEISSFNGFIESF